METLRGRKAVVTGGGSGIGRGIALALADEGMDVAIADIELESAEKVAEELRARGVRSFGMKTDVTHCSSLAALAERVEAEFCGLHLLSNNAGVNYQGLLEDATEADWNWILSVNLFGMIKAVEAFLPLLKAQDEPTHIVNNTSMAALVCLPEIRVGVYTVSKYAAAAYCEQLRAELAPSGIGVSILCPGMVRSNLAATSARNRPAEYGGPMPDPGSNMTPEVEASQMEPEEVGPIVVRGVRENRAYIFTHPQLKDVVGARFAQIAADFDAEAKAQAALSK
jgi:NAD(P)-dependent dehydrogenase (short-subunit alcohol dehydrogenase family)